MNIFKKVVVGFMFAAFVSVYAAPFGMCASTASLPPLPISSQSKSIKTSDSAFSINSDIKISKTNTPITLSLRNADVKQVLRMFADKAGMNIMFHPSLDEGDDSKPKSVTMDLVKVPLNEAFKMVIQVSDLAYYVQGNTIVVLSAETAKSSGIGKQNMSVIPVKYLDASKVASFLNRNIFSSGQPGLSSGEIAVTNSETNEIILFGNQNDYQIAKKIVNQFDVKPNEETFIVNHTTPKEMSNMICKVLFKDLAKKEGDETVVLSDENESDDDDDDDDSDDDEASAVKVGQGKIACQFRPAVGGGGENGLVSLDSGGLTIVYFADRGTIYARGGTNSQMAQIKDFIAKNDKHQFQAYLEMSIVELSESGSKEFSNTWNIYSSFFTGGFSGAGGVANSAPMYMVGDAVPDMYQPTTPILPKYTGAPVVTYAINYLISNGKARTLANPRILITSGQKAKIDLTSSYIKKVTSQVMDTVSTAVGAVQKTYDIGEDLGIIIDLYPYISPDGYVTMNIVPSYSTIKEKVTEPRTLVVNQTLGTTQTVNDLVATLIDKRELNLKNIKIKDGETMVIGGLLQEIETKHVYKVPFLGDLPVIGMLFRSTTSDKEKAELVIMLTPRIIQESINNNETVNKAAL